MTIGRETGRCAEKREKVEGVLRYMLIGALEPPKIGKRSARRREP